MRKPVCKIARENGGTVSIQCVFGCPFGCTSAAPQQIAGVYGPPLTCRVCGSGNLYWQMAGGTHRMYDRSTLEPHVCATSADGFEEEPV